MALINLPPIRGLENSFPWLAEWFMQVYRLCFSIQESGITANRPIKSLWVGRMYFDTTLGIPIWLKDVATLDWVDASGASV